MTTIKIKGHGEFSATEQMTARFDGLKKTELVKRIAGGYSDKTFGVAHWRRFPKETLAVVAASLLAIDEDRKTNVAPVGVDHGEQTPAQVVGAATGAVVEPTAELAPIAPATEGKPAYVLRCKHRPGWLRRHQPRKPGDTAAYKVVEDIGKASTYHSRRQAEAKLAEAAGLLDVPAEIEGVA